MRKLEASYHFRFPADYLDFLGYANLGVPVRRVFDASRQTVIVNAAHEPGTRYARYASPTACAFCRMLATRTTEADGLYFSKQSATRVVGRGGRPRGTQAIGDRFHDNCKCVAVAIRPGDTYEPPEFVAKWDKEYKAAAANGGGVKAILREMRKNDIH